MRRFFAVIAVAVIVIFGAGVAAVVLVVAV